MVAHVSKLYLTGRFILMSLLVVIGPVLSQADELYTPLQLNHPTDFNYHDPLPPAGSLELFNLADMDPTTIVGLTGDHVALLPYQGNNIYTLGSFNAQVA